MLNLKNTNPNVQPNKGYSKLKWRSILGLILMYIAIWFNWQWAWGILFLVWVIPDLFSGTTYFLDIVEKKNDPILYWIIIVSWLIFSILSLASIVYEDLSIYY